MQLSENTILLVPANLLDDKYSQPAPLTMQAISGKFYRQHLWLPLTAFAMLSVLLTGLGADQWLADRIYVAGGHAWAVSYTHLDVYKRQS